MHFTSIKLERMPQPEDEPDSTEPSDSPESGSSESGSSASGSSESGSSESGAAADAGEGESGEAEPGRNGDGTEPAGPDPVAAPGAAEFERTDFEAVAPDDSQPATGEESDERPEAGGHGVAEDRVGDGGVVQHGVQGDDNSPAAAEASGHPAGGESG
jgi:hypothetical protein